MIAVCLAFLVLSTGAADNGEPVRVGVYDFAPLSCTSDPHSPHCGIFTTLLNEIAAREGWKLEYVPGSLEEGLERLEAGQIDLLMAATYSPAAAERFDFTRETVISTWAQLYTTPDTRVQSLLDLDGLSIGVNRDDPYNRELRTTIKRLNIKCTFVEFNHSREVLEGLEKKWVDAGIVDRLYAVRHENDYHVKKEPIILAPVELRFAAPKNRTRYLISALDLHLGRMKEDSSSLYYQTVEREFGKTGDTKLLRTLGWGLAIALGVVVLLVGMTLILRRQVKNRTAELSRKNTELEQEVQMRRLAEDALRRSNQLLSNTFSSMRDGLVVIDSREDRILSFNAAAGAMLKYTEDELRDLPPTTLLQQYASVMEFRDVLSRAVADHGFYQAETRIRRRDDTTFPAELVITPIRDGNENFMLWVMIIRDISERVQAQRALQDSEARLRQAQKMEAIGTLAGGIAHDFNNILVPILGYAQIVRESLSEPGPCREYMDEILTAGYRAKSLVSQILSFSRSSDQQPEPIHLSLITQEVSKLLRASLPSTIQINLELHADEDVIAADPTRIHQVLMNLCSNAAYAMQFSGGALTIAVNDHEGPLLGWGAKEELGPGQFLRLSVSDEGEGIDPAIMHRVFDPFFTTKRHGEGTGMGLAVVHGIVSGYNGAVSVETAYGSGTTMHVYLPKTSAPAPQAPPCRRKKPRGRQERIMVVDDEQMIVDMMQRYLSDLNYRVDVFTSSEKAMAHVSTDPDGIDLVITDQTMPRLTGAELARNILNLRPDMPIILLTGFSEMISESGARQIGIKRYMTKPFQPREMATTIRDLLDESQRNRTEAALLT